MFVSARQSFVRHLKWASTHLPIVAIHGFAAALIGVIWLGTTWLIAAERERGERELAIETANLSLAFAQNVVRTASELDRILLFLRKSHERSGRATPWQHLIKDEYTINEQTVQIAVIDRKGMMITSTAMLYPARPVDLSDREHFRFHATSTDDQLYISKPVIGRASGKWSVQFTRKLMDETGAFDGVLVVSLDPAHLSRAFSNLSLEQGGVALIGLDGIVRAGIGRYENALGRGLREGTVQRTYDGVPQDVSVTLQRVENEDLLIANRRVLNYPLEVVVATRSLAASPDWVSKKRTYFAVASVLSLLAFAAMLIASYTHRRNERRLLRVARQDGLTRLGNRLQFQETLQELLERSLSPGTIALHLIDLDGFKDVNDAYGHPTGDKLLKAVAERLLENTRPTDRLARLGGDEFALIQPAIATDAASQSLADRLVQTLAEPFEIDGNSINIGASVGIAIAGVDGNTVGDLVRAADLALYCAKFDGRGQARRFNASMNEAVIERRQLEAELRIALDRGELELHYQPIMHTPTRRFVGCEALLRWRHPVRGLIPPLKFVPIAEEAGLIDRIGAWVIEQACRDAASWPEELWVAVNCSARQFRSGALPATISKALSQSGLAPSRLEIEITETMLMNRDPDTYRQLAEIRDLGVSIALDDFGTGYSSLAYLKDFPVDCIKIDRSFLAALDKGDSSSMIIKAIVAMASAFGMRTVAEGVEHQWQLDTVAALGCSEVQGYFIGRPAPNADTLERIGPARGAPVLAA